jgi:molybdate transport system substrate-binding protein
MSRRWTPLLLAAGLLAAACGSGDDDTVLVLAASSLTYAFEEMEVAYERANPGLDVEVSFAGSSALRLQIDQGAPADVVAVANEEVMTALAGEGHVTIPIVFATNRLVIASPADGSESVTGPESLTDPDLLVGLCALQVPCGQYASDALVLAGIEPSVDTYESDVRSLTTKLAIGELDVGIVYETDAASRPDDIIVIAPLGGADVLYPIAPLTDAPHAEEAAAFVEFVLSAEGQAIMSEAGFGTP